IFVLPSLNEGISNTILEAMASGLPVIATRVGGNIELVDENITGLLVPTNNPNEMADALLVYIKDIELARKHGKAGRERVEALFSMNKMIENYTKVYDSLLALSDK
ncbi:MAG: glycosyltransferase, partial [Gammaproteobacteria bacterium]|nr:glycosyltransferase [Gammaproteobacteria bacterium]